METAPRNCRLLSLVMVERVLRYAESSTRDMREKGNFEGDGGSNKRILSCMGNITVDTVKQGKD